MRTQCVIYTYDLVGNLQSKTRSGSNAEIITYEYYANGNDQLWTETSNVNPAVTYPYDANGSMTSKTVGSTTLTYAYNIEQRLKQLTVPSTHYPITYDYTYNDQGIRTSQLHSDRYRNETMSYYHIDPANPTGYAQVFEELDAGYNTTMTYTIGDDVICQGTDADVIHYLGYDGHGSTRLLLASDGTIAASYDFDAYGYMERRSRFINLEKYLVAQ